MLASNFEHRYSFETVIFWHVSACRSNAYLEAGDSSVLQNGGTRHQTAHRHNPQNNNFHSFCRGMLMSLFSYYIMFCDDIYAF
jgi:hypothetical protein